jgi:hypothetical protein
MKKTKPFKSLKNNFRFRGINFFSLSMVIITNNEKKLMKAREVSASLFFCFEVMGIEFVNGKISRVEFALMKFLK